MHAAVLDIDLSNEHIQYSITEETKEAFILVRWKKSPIGHLWLPVVDKKLAVDDVRETLTCAVETRLRHLVLKESLGIDWQHEMLPPKTGATVAICTRDRPEDIKRCLSGLSAMPDDGQEILVIDNCPSDDSTRKIVAQFPNVNYVVEDKPGLNNARNKAMQAAKNEIIAFIDDDATPDRYWLRCLVNTFDDPLVLCVSGLTVPLTLETNAQVWHERYSTFSRGLDKKVFDTVTFMPAAAGQVGAGVNMALRKKTYDLLGPFDPALDAGTVTCSGGDTEMFIRILSSGYRVIYNPAALSWHRHRETWKELRKAAFGYGVGVYAAWTATLVRDREIGCFYVAWAWFKHQAQSFFRSLFKRSGSLPLDIVTAEFAGCLLGPYRYLKSTIHASRLQKSVECHERN